MASGAQVQLTKNEDTIDYEVVREEVYDAPIKTQVLQRVRMLSVPTETQLRSLLMSRAEPLKQRTGFRYHAAPTNVGVYVYETAEQANAAQGLWMGMLFWRPEDGPPQLTVNQSILGGAGQPPTDRLGLSEAKRKEIFAEHVLAEDRGQKEVERRRPVENNATLRELSAK
jgi:hypothetical protein